MRRCAAFLIEGGVPEWLNGTVSKTVARKGLVSSNLTPSAEKITGSLFFDIFYGGTARGPKR
jgi:hypothetical protein